MMIKKVIVFSLICPFDSSSQDGIKYFTACEDLFWAKYFARNSAIFDKGMTEEDIWYAIWQEISAFDSILQVL